MARSPLFTRLMTASAALASAGLLLVSAAPASAATVLDGPVGLGSAANFGVLSSSTVTNTGSSVITGNVGVSPGTAIVGFPPGIINGVQHSADAQAAQAQSDLTTAYNVAASLTPTQTGLGELAGLSLIPGVYSGGALSLNGALTLEGTAESVWVFQADSTLVAGSSANIILTGGASACNVFWQVGSSATLGSDTQFVGTVMAKASITAVTSADVIGRLLAETGAVTLDSNVITAPTGCDAGSNAVSTSPTITSSTPPAARVGDAYSFTVTATGTPAATFSVTGALPAGLTFNSATGVISGIPTTAGSSPITITASNGTAPDATADYTLTTAAATLVAPVVPAAPEAPAVPVVPAVTPDAADDLLLAETGAEPNTTLLAVGGLLLLLSGVVVLMVRRHRSHAA